MPVTAPENKLNAVKRLGAKVTLYGENLAEALVKAAEISKKFNCNFDQIICGSGSDEIIQMICQLFLKKSDEVIVPKFSFLMYRIYSGIVGAKIVYSIENNFKILL